MTTQCSVCGHPRRGEVDDLLDQGVPLRTLAGQLGISRQSVHRHAQHRHERRALGQQLLRLSTPEPEAPASISHSFSALGRFGQRLEELAAQTAQVAQVAAQSRDARLLLQALRSESDQLVRLSALVPTGHEQAFTEGRDRTLTVISRALAEAIPDRQERDQLVATLNRRLVAAGIDHPEAVAV